MHLALRQAVKGRGKTSPNPMVGAVIVKNGEIIGKGYHKAPGRDHAEVDAIKKAKGKTKGATLYVTLEPCNHTGRTGPCTEAIIEAGIKRVVIPLKDPNPLVNGNGIRRLRKAGIKVDNGILKEEASILNDAYIGYYQNKRPYIILKEAQSLDGRIATLSGDARWISGPEAQRLAHSLRAEVDAVVVGMNTVIKDNPRLTVRNVKGDNPYRIVLSGSLDFPPRTKLLTDNKDYKTIIASSAKALAKFVKNKKRSNLIFWDVKLSRNGDVDLKDFITKAYDFGFRYLLVEGGGQLAASFIKAGLVDKYIFITAPIIIGDGINTVGALNAAKITDAVKFRETAFFQMGDDMVFIGYPERK